MGPSGLCGGGRVHFIIDLLKDSQKTNEITEKTGEKNYFTVGKPHRLKSDERKDERKRGTNRNGKV